LSSGTFNPRSLGFAIAEVHGYARASARAAAYRASSSRSSTRIVQLGLQRTARPASPRRRKCAHAPPDRRVPPRRTRFRRGLLGLLRWWGLWDPAARSKYMSAVARRQVGKMRRIMAAERARLYRRIVLNCLRSTGPDLAQRASIITLVARLRIDRRLGTQRGPFIQIGRPLPLAVCA
jgi:hypothetical protein